MNKPTFTCCICKKTVTGYGNNPFPVATDGLCCDECNSHRVIPERIRLYQGYLDPDSSEARGER